ncbi:tRNA (adenosine(37)-N6)-threonylcarbamoyltransferase complex ATPase subunit type 1 TsaE [Candidatus Gottesmanbacteria bacterium]|nr:tRNA (adenosine(37)-N6)-threonylcarbamoyltransferase complex ATPase subunit type 1 TsaE [Candidatus Gottesmanbacteria bacterium]
MITKTAQETRNLGEKLAEKIKNGGVVCLYGDLGAGKTTFVQGIAKGLGIKKQITSPTFIIMRSYGRLWHLDLYRLNSLEEIKALGVEEIWQDENNILVIEWPEKIEPILPENKLTVHLTTLADNTHEITY